jgi:NADH-quinone oxidoreductase subunit L
MTHAFFKSVLFLGAGNVMHAMDEEKYINKMGGLGKVMPWTMIIMIIASTALAGIWPFAGFFSKDKILETAFSQNHYFLWIILWAGAGMTAYYSFRLIMMVFTGTPKYDKEKKHPHEAYNFVIAAMIPLAILAMIAGFFEHSFVHYVTEEVLPEYEPHVGWFAFLFLLVVTLGIALSGIYLAYTKFKNDGSFDDFFKKIGVYNLLANQYYIPDIYAKYIMEPYKKLSDFAWKSIDLKIVDATVDLIAGFIYKSGDKARWMQSGNLSTNLKWMGLGIVALMAAILLFRPTM